MRSLTGIGRGARKAILSIGLLSMSIGVAFSQTSSSKLGVDAAQPVDIVAVDKLAEDRSTPPGPGGEFERLPIGYRRVAGELRQPLTAEQREELVRLGKEAQIDPVTNERVIRVLQDYLPEAWGLHRQDGGPVDSLGRPIVNTAPGLPGWSQADVDALRETIGHWLGVRVVQANGGGDLTETDGIIGNYVGQAIVRGIAYDDLVDLTDVNLVTDVMADSIIGYLHFYENQKHVHSMRDGSAYSPTVYPDTVVAFVTAHGRSMDDVLRIETPEEGGVADSTCYIRNTFARGITLLSGQTDIWVTSGDDDASADIPTGFPLFFFYECQDGSNNSQVRVSTNGYATFFQRGGGALDGTNFSNDPIPSALDPDGYIAPWWDDLWIAPNQGNTDRVSYKTEGAAGSRVFTIEWFSVSRLGGSTDEFHFFQIKLYEMLGVIELHYGLEVSGWQSDTSDNATLGIENYDGGEGNCGPNCLNDNNGAPPNNYVFVPSPRPLNDSCADAFYLRYADNITGINLRNATADGDSNCPGNGNRDVWYTFVSRCTGTLRVSTCGTRDAGGPDTVLSVHRGCPGTSQNVIACNDDASAPNCNGLDSEVEVNVGANQQVWIRVTHFGDSEFRFGNGLVNLRTRFTPAANLPNDDCQNAIEIANRGLINGNLMCANATGTATCGFSNGNPDLWYRFTAPPPGGLLVLDTCGSRDMGGSNAGADTVLSVYSGCPGTENNQLACNDDGFAAGCNTLDSRLTIQLAPCQSILIRVSHFGVDPINIGNGGFWLRANLQSCIRGDSNCDGLINNFDIDCFVRALSGGQNAWNAACFNPPNCGYLCSNDVNGDGLVNNFDIDAFVLALTDGPCP